MEITPEIGADRQLIQAYRPGLFRIAAIEHRGSVLVFPTRVLAWTPSRLEDVDAASLEPVAAAEPPVEVLLLGTGARFALPPPALRSALRARGVVIEAMATPAACRTFNVLLAEDRRVAAALIAMP